MLMQSNIHRGRPLAAPLLIVFLMIMLTVYFITQVYHVLWQQSTSNILRQTVQGCDVLRAQITYMSESDEDTALTFLFNSLSGKTEAFCVLNAQGDILVNPQNAGSANLFDALNNGKNEVSAVARFAKSLRQGEPGAATLCLETSNTLLCYAPIGAETGLYLVTLLPVRTLLQQTTSIAVNTMMPLLCILPGSFLLALLCARQASRTQRLLNAKNREQNRLDVQRTEARSSLLSSVSHDIRTPMNAIVGLATLIERDADSPQKVREYVAKLHSAGHYLLGLINDVLDMSRIESGKAAICSKVFSLAELVDSINTVLRPQMDAKFHHFTIHVSGVASENLLGDKLHINQILFNLLSNAAKYTPNGGEIDLFFEGIEDESKGEQRLRFTVKDNGIGISPEYQKSIFSPFTREMSSASKGIQGTGLGMAITKNLVDLMGGTIHVQSQPGAGSTFTVELPLGIARMDAHPTFWSKHGIRRMLVLSQDADLLSAMVHAMDGSDVDVSRAACLADAERLICAARQAEHPLDLVLMGPEPTGFADTQAVQRIRSLLPPQTLIIAMTDGARQMPNTDTASAWMPGPFFASCLRKTVEDLYAAPQFHMKAGEDNLPLEGMHLLVAEDNPLNSEIITELLRMVGASCTIAQDGLQAVTRLQKEPPNTFDMVLMDVQMPVMDGYEATRAIRSSEHPRACTIPIVAMTANAFAEDMKRARMAGMDAHVAKPIELPLLVETILRLHDADRAEARKNIKIPDKAGEDSP